MKRYSLGQVNQMIHFIDKVLENLQAYIPLMQTLVWPIVVIIVVIVFRTHVRACIDAIRKRIEAGGGMKAGPFELPPLAPATAQEQTKKLEEEAAEESKEELTSSSAPKRNSGVLIDQRDFMSSYMMAEDLVMKKLSAELNLKIVRQVKAERGVRYIFDGVVIDSGRFTAIEVKMVRKAILSKMLTRQTLDRLNTYYTSLGEDSKRGFSLILAIVIDEGSPDEALRQLSFVRETYQFPVHIQCYRMADLKAEFGIR